MIRVLAAGLRGIAAGLPGFFRGVVREYRRTVAAAGALTRRSSARTSSAQDLEFYRLRRCARGCAVWWYGNAKLCAACGGPGVDPAPGEILRAPLDVPAGMPVRLRVVLDEWGNVCDSVRPEPPVPVRALAPDPDPDPAPAPPCSVVSCLCGGHPVALGQSSEAGQ
jgi:hypothetical protein